MIVYPILITVSRVVVIWAKRRTVRKIAMTTTQIFILLAIAEIHKKNDDKREDR